MEKQNKADTCQINFSPQQMYDIRQRNYDWESFKYVLPRKYTHNPTSNLRSGSLFFNKTNYLDDLQKAKKKIPGPNHYKYSINTLRPTSGKMDKGERKTMSEEVKCKSQKQNHPGPGYYFKRPQSAMTFLGSSSSNGKNKITIEKKHYLNEVEYLAAILPGVGAYNLTSPKHVAGPKLFKRAYHNNDRKDKQNEQNQKILNTAECVSGTFEWMKTRSKKKNSNFFGKSKRFVTESKFEKKPGPNIYKLNNEWDSKTNLTNMTCTSNSNLKTVYYH